MPTPRLHRDTADIVAAWESSSSARDFCRTLGFRFNLDAVRRMIAEAELDYPAPHWNQPIAPLSGTQKPAEEIHAHNLEVQRLKDELAATKRLYTAACKQENLHADVLDVAREVMGRVAPMKLLPPHIGRGKSPETEDAILGLADFHGGEVIDYDTMQGYNAYDPTIMCRRVQYAVDTALHLLFDCHTGTTFEHLYVFDLGDSITGDLLLDNATTNALPVFESMRLVAHVKARALCELSAHIPVIYVGVPGNHGRRSAKMPWKQPTETADWLIAEMVGDLCRDNERVTVHVPKAWTVGITVRGWNHSLNHGYSAAKGGYGGIPWYAFQRADGKKTALESAHGKRVHFRWYGHVHTAAELPKMDGAGKQFIVGSLKGGDEYALEELNAYGDPEQLLVGCHEKTGVSWRYPLYVKHGDDKPSRYEELIP